MLNIVFMGSPEFAVPSLESLHGKGHSISLVVTQKDRPKGRGKKLLPTPVKSFRIEFRVINLILLTLEGINQIKNWTVALWLSHFGQILKRIF